MSEREPEEGPVWFASSGELKGPRIWLRLPNTDAEKRAWMRWHGWSEEKIEEALSAKQ